MTSPFFTVTGITWLAAAARASSVSTWSTTAETVKNLSMRCPASSVLLTAGRDVCLSCSLALYRAVSSSLSFTPPSMPVRMASDRAVLSGRLSGMAPAAWRLLRGR